MKKRDYVWEIASGESIPVKIKLESYRVNDTLAVMLCGKNGFEEVITVNLPESILLPEKVQFVDTNNFPGIAEWLEANGIATATGISAHSGFCTYPAYHFQG